MSAASPKLLLGSPFVCLKEFFTFPFGSSFNPTVQSVSVPTHLSVLLSVSLLFLIRFHYGRNVSQTSLVGKLKEHIWENGKSTGNLLSFQFIMDYYPRRHFVCTWEEWILLLCGEFFVHLGTTGLVSIHPATSSWFSIWTTTATSLLLYCVSPLGLTFALYVWVLCYWVHAYLYNPIKLTLLSLCNDLISEWQFWLKAYYVQLKYSHAVLLIGCTEALLHPWPIYRLYTVYLLVGEFGLFPLKVIKGLLCPCCKLVFSLSYSLLTPLSSCSLSLWSGVMHVYVYVCVYICKRVYVHVCVCVCLWALLLHTCTNL